MIIKMPHPVLVRPASSVKKIDREVREIIEELKKNLLSAENPKGVGLAAPQIGVSLQIFVTRPKEKEEIRVFLNPEIIWQSKEMGEEPKKNSDKNEQRLEGCLSLPHLWGHVQRHRQVKMRYLTEQGEKKEELFSGLMAIIVQHEVDHLKGILFPQRVLEQKGKLYKVQKDSQGKEKLVEHPFNF